MKDRTLGNINVYGTGRDRREYQIIVENETQVGTD